MNDENVNLIEDGSADLRSNKAVDVDLISSFDVSMNTLDSSNCNACL